MCSRSPHEPVGLEEGPSSLGCAAADRLAGEEAVRRITSGAGASRIGGLCFRISRWRGDRSADAGPDCSSDGFAPGGPLRRERRTRVLHSMPGVRAVFRSDVIGPARVSTIVSRDAASNETQDLHSAWISGAVRRGSRLGWQAPVSAFCRWIFATGFQRNPKSDKTHNVAGSFP